jgi:hypothetical protein
MVVYGVEPRDASALLDQSQSSRLTFQFLKPTNPRYQNSAKHQRAKWNHWYSRSGTGPLIWEGEGITANVIDIISKTLAIEPRERVLFLSELTRLMLSSSTFLRLAGLAAALNASNEFRVIGFRDRSPGRRVLKLQNDSTKSATATDVPSNAPASGHNRRLSKISPRTNG